jgi:hypothetical protein
MALQLAKEFVIPNGVCVVRNLSFLGFRAAVVIAQWEGSPFGRAWL